MVSYTWELGNRKTQTEITFWILLRTHMSLKSISDVNESEKHWSAFWSLPFHSHVRTKTRVRTRANDDSFLYGTCSLCFTVQSLTLFQFSGFWEHFRRNDLIMRSPIKGAVQLVVALQATTLMRKDPSVFPAALRVEELLHTTNTMLALLYRNEC